MRKKLITILFLTLMPLLSNAETKELKSGDTFTATVNGTTFNMKVINPLFKTCVVGSGKRGDAFVSGGKNWDGTFPSKVTDSDGLVFTVIGVNNRAFFENDGINTITLPANTNVDLYEGAFMRCHNLTTIIIPEGVTILGLGQYVFNGCFDRDFFREATLELPSTLRTINKGDYDSPFRNMALRKVIAKMEEPFSISTLFSDDHYANATLYVPYGKADVYKNTEGWKKFSNIVELIPGDVNGEGNVDEEDIKSMSEIIVKQKDQTAATPNADLNGDHQITEADRLFIGDPNPDIYGNIFTGITYKHLKLDLRFNYSLGNDVYNYQRSQLEGGSRFMNQSTTMVRRWQVEGQHTDVPQITFQDPLGNSRFSDRWIEDGSYLRLKTVTLSYDLPLKSQYIQGLQFWIQGNNLLTFTKYLGTDPEFTMTSSVIGQGIDLGRLGQSRSVVAGVKINL